MKIGEYWIHKYDETQILKLVEFHGRDFWGCINLDDGCSYDLTGKEIYNDFRLITDLNIIRSLEEDLQEFNALKERLIIKTNKLIKGETNGK